MINLKKWGDMEIKNPSLATSLEFVSLWATVHNDISQLARVCAGSIGVCLDYSGKLPKYKPAHHKPLEYGHICLDRLLSAGIPSSTIYLEGTKCLTQMSSALPTDEGIEEKTDFLGVQGQDLGSS